jgi:hypothetical protein
MNQAVKWEDALKITETKNVEDALHAFKDSPSEDNAVGLAQYIIETYLQQEADRTTLMLQDELRVQQAADLHDDRAEPIPLAQERKKQPWASSFQSLLTDGRRFRILACGLMLAARRDDNHSEVDEMIAKIDKAVDEIIGDDDVPDLTLIRRVADQLYARGLLMEVEDEPHDDKAAG